MAAATPRSVILPVSMILFGLGLLAIIAIFALFAAGYENMPIWLNLATLLCPAGLIFGVIATVLRSRKR